MKFVFILYLLIKIHYPSNDIETVRQCNKLVDDAMKSYCFVGIEYDLTTNTDCADIEIRPYFNFFFDPTLIGLTHGNIHLNKDIYGIPSIRISEYLEYEDAELVLRHELYHALVPYYLEREKIYHSNDPLSLMYPVYTGYNKYLSRNDSILLINAINGIR